jgi:hypothetical protein
MPLHGICICDPHQPDAPSLVHPLLLGLYVDDFVYFSKDPAVEALFCRLLGECCKVDFMGIVEWFLGVHISWRISSSTVSVHMNQSGFASNLVESFFCKTCNETPLVTPYRSGIPVDSIPPSTDTGNSPAQLRQTQAYQSLIGSIGWLAMTTRPDLTTIHSFLSSYRAKPAVGHMKSALYALHYIHSTYNYGITFTSDDVAPMHSYIHYPPFTDVKAYKDAIPPKLSNSNTNSAYSNVC